jgi:hypothetical protein
MAAVERGAKRSVVDIGSVDMAVTKVADEQDIMAKAAKMIRYSPPKKLNRLLVLKG